MNKENIISGLLNKIMNQREIKVKLWSIKNKIMYQADNDSYAIQRSSNFMGLGQDRYLVLGFHGEIIERENGNINYREDVTKDYIKLQYIGLLDKDKVEIYEGDLLQPIHSGYEPREIFEVKWIGVGFWLLNKMSKKRKDIEPTLDNIKSMKIIGNVFENKELL